VLLGGRQTLAQRVALCRTAGQLSVLLSGAAFDLGDFPGAYAHLLTAEQLGREVGDHALLASVRAIQTMVALWDGDLSMALSYAQDGRRYATNGGQRAVLAIRGEARALARMGDPSGFFEALRRAERARPGHYQPPDDPYEAWWSYNPADFELYTGISLLWLGQPADAEPHARQAIASYQDLPSQFQTGSNPAQARIIIGSPELSVVDVADVA